VQPAATSLKGTSDLLPRTRDGGPFRERAGATTAVDPMYTSEA
jgi:hypothetical protein